MSFRNPFVTDFIYQASDDTRGANADLTAVFEKYAAFLSSRVDERGYGYYAGWFRTLDGSIRDIGLEDIEHELQNATKVPFRLSVLVETGPAIIYAIKPRA